MDDIKREALKEFAEKLKIKAIRLSEIENYHVCNLIDELLKEYEKRSFIKLMNRYINPFK